MNPFPKPAAVIAGRNFWEKGEIRHWAAAIAGKPEPNPQPDDEVLLNSGQVRALFGGVSDMWIWRRRYPQKAAAANRARGKTAAETEIASP